MTDFLVDMEVKLGYDGDDEDKILDHLAFTVCDKYRCEVFWLNDGTDLYKLSLYKVHQNRDELIYDTIFDSDLGVLQGDECIYTYDDIDDIIKQCFDIIKRYIKHPKTGGLNNVK